MGHGKRMMVVGIGLAMALSTARCFDPDYPEGLPCDLADDCPPGQTCRAGTCTRNANGCIDGEERTCANGMCRADGVQRCAGGTWGACIGASTPTAEVCDVAMVDEDCDGTPNQMCPCLEGESHPCGTCGDGRQECSLAGELGACTGASVPPECCPGTTRACGVDEGACQMGTQTCMANGRWGAACVGEIGRQPETCNGIDDNCDGTVDGPSACYCRLYTGSNHATLCQTIDSSAPDDPNLHSSPSCGDKISSIACSPGTQIRLYLDTNYAGNSWLLEGSIPTLHVDPPYANLGDNASSARLTRRP